MAAIWQTTVSKNIFLNENDRIPIQIPLKFVPRSLIGNKPAFVLAMAKRRTGGKPLFEQMLTQSTDAYIGVKSRTLYRRIGSAPSTQTGPAGPRCVRLRLGRLLHIPSRLRQLGMWNRLAFGISGGWRVCHRWINVLHSSAKATPLLAEKIIALPLRNGVGMFQLGWFRSWNSAKYTGWFHRWLCDLGTFVWQL